MSITPAPQNPADLQALEEKLDPEMRFRPLVSPAQTVVKALLIALSIFHFYTLCVR